MRQLPQKLWNLFRHLDLQGPGRQPARRTPRRRLELELLEDRSVPTATVSGVAFIDGNGNGVFDPGEAVLPGVTVVLTGTTTSSAPVSATATTDANGSYSFQNVLPGTYQVSAAAPPGVLGGSPSFTTASGSAGEDLVSGITVSDGQTVTENLGFLGLGPSALSPRMFLSTTTAANFPDTTATPGSGKTLVNPRANSAPTVAVPIADVAVAAGSSPTTIDLAANFTDPDLANSKVTFNTSDGPLNVTLFDATAPQTVANFYDYIKSGAYNNSIFSRLVPGFVLQGGGATLQTTASGSALTPISTLPPVANEFSASNTTGTLAMAQSSGDPNSATDQFFFNLTNNNASGTTNLDAQKFTVFGQVASSSDQSFLLNTLAATPTQNESSSAAAATLPTVDLSNVPLKNYTGTNFPTDATASNFLVVNGVTVDSRPEFLTYSVVNNSNPGLVNPVVSNERLVLNYTPGQTGTATITIRATDSLGATVDNTFNVTVS